MGKYGDLNPDKVMLRRAHIIRWVALLMLSFAAAFSMAMAYVVNVWFGIVFTVTAGLVCLMVAHAIAHPYNCDD